MQVIKNDCTKEELKNQLIENEKRAIKAESQIERLQMELQMLKLESNINIQHDIKSTSKTFADYVQMIQEDLEKIYNEKAFNSNLLSEFVIRNLEFYRSQQDRFPLAFAQVDFKQLQNVSKLFRNSAEVHRVCVR